MATLVFCTAFADSQDAWTFRYAKWLHAVRQSPLARDQILLVDDGSPVEPPLAGLERYAADALPDARPAGETVHVRFAERLGRAAMFDYPGWWRSFGLAAVYARRYGFDKVVHLESDTFLLSRRLYEHVNALSSGWTVFWCPRWGFPETCLQVIGPDAVGAYCAVSQRPYSEMVGHPVEKLLPFTALESGFKGDRYGEYRTELPADADYASQVALSTPVWQGTPPPLRRVLSVALGARPFPAHQALFPSDAWRHLPSVAADEAAAFGAVLAGQPRGSLHAIQITLSGEERGAAGDREAVTAAAAGVRAAIAADGELVARVVGGTGEDALDWARRLAGAGFADVGMESAAGGGYWIVALAGGPLPAALVRERLTLRLRLVAACHL
jgi:hypothetical protein